MGYKTLILSTQVKRGKVHPTAITKIDSPHCNPTQSSSETLPVFSLQCFHRNWWISSGVENFNPFLSVLLSTGMGGKLKNPSSCTVSKRFNKRYLWSFSKYNNDKVSYLMHTCTTHSCFMHILRKQTKCQKTMLT